MYKNQSNMDTLPIEIVITIFNEVLHKQDIDVLLQLVLVSKHFNNIVQQLKVYVSTTFKSTTGDMLYPNDLLIAIIYTKCHPNKYPFLKLYMHQYSNGKRGSVILYSNESYLFNVDTVNTIAKKYGVNMERINIDKKYEKNNIIKLSLDDNLTYYRIYIITKYCYSWNGMSILKLLHNKDCIYYNRKQSSHIKTMKKPLKDCQTKYEFITAIFNTRL